MSGKLKNTHHLEFKIGGAGGGVSKLIYMTSFRVRRGSLQTVTLLL